MFFYLSKIAWLFLQPLSLTGMLLGLAVIAMLLRWRKLAFTSALLAFAVLGLSAWTSLGAILLQPLEDRIARPADMPPEIAGIIVLGGGFEGSVNAARGGYELNSAGDRFVETAVLARRFPEAKIVVTGGGSSLLLAGEADADSAPRLLVALGVAQERLVLENQSRNTFENAGFTRDLLAPDSSQNWLLVTSAFHMPRSVALFRKAGFTIVPWPVDYRTAGTETAGLARDNAIDSLENTTLAIREWVGLLAYWLVGRIDSVLPAEER